MAPIFPLSNPGSLKNRVIHASLWSLGGYGLSLAIRLGSNLVLTRLLFPRMFGVMAIASVFMVGLTLFSDLGLRQNIVQSRRGNDWTFLNTVWSVQIIRALLLWALALLCSAAIIIADHVGKIPAQSAYADPILPYVIAALSFGVVVNGFISTKLHEASRNLMLRQIKQNEIISQIAGVFFMFAWVLFDRSIWALVAGTLARGFVRVLLSHIALPGTNNRWHWDKSAFQEIFGFGKWIFLSSLLAFLALNADRIVLSGAVDSSILGIYAIAYTIYSSLEEIIRRIVSDVAYPALSTIVRDRPNALKANSYRFHVVIASLAYFFCGLLLMSGEALIGVLYDPRYAQAGWMLEILAVGLLAVPFEISNQTFMALGMPRLLSRVLGIRVIALFTTMPLGFHFFGIQGALWGIVLSQLLSMAQVIVFSVKLKLFDLRRELLVSPMILVGLTSGYFLTALIRIWHTGF